MKHSEFEELFLDYVEGVLPKAQRKELEAALSHDPALAQKLQDYRNVIALEQRAAAVEVTPSLGFATRVIENSKEQEESFLRRLFMGLLIENRKWFATGATVLAAGLVVVMANTTPQEMIAITRTASKDAPVTVENEEAGSVPKIRVVPPGFKTYTLAEVEALHRSNDPTLGERSTTPLTDATEESPNLGSSASGDSAITSTTRVDGPNESAGPGYSLRSEALSDSSKYATAPNGSLHAIGEPLPRVAPRSIIQQQEAAVYSEQANMRFRHPQQQQSVEATERYFGEQSSQPIMTAQNRVSTFSIDVDTASYTNARRFLQSGRLPPADAVRTEEFVNYFDYNYPEQFNKRFGVHYEMAPSPLIKGHHLLKIGIRAKDIKDSDKPWNLVFLVDVSGSMSSPSKLALLQQSLKVLASNMRPQDKVALVTYANGSAVRLEPTAGSNKAAINAAIDSLAAGGGTNGEGGIQLAYEVALRNKLESGVNRVILATDGDFNVGVTSHDALIKMIEEKRKLGVSLTTIGVGDGNLNDATLEQLANKGNGNYFYLDSFKEARKVFEKQLAGTIETVAKDVKLQIEFNPKHVVQYKLIGFENRTLARKDFNNDAVDAGEIGSGHTVTALYDLVLAGTEAAKDVGDQSRYQDPQPTAVPATSEQFPAELGFLKIRSKAPNSDSSDLEEFPVLRADMKDSVDGTSQDFRFAAAVAGFAEDLRGNKMLPLSEIVSLAQANRGSDESGIRQEFIELLRNAEALAKQ